MASDRQTDGHGCGQWINNIPINFKYGDGQGITSSLTLPDLVHFSRKRVW